MNAKKYELKRQNNDFKPQNLTRMETLICWPPGDHSPTYTRLPFPFPRETTQTRHACAQATCHEIKIDEL